MTATRLPTKPAKKLMTADEFWDFGNLPENENKSFELIRGEVVEMSRTTRQHGMVCSNINFYLSGWVRTVRYGYVASNDTGVLLERDPDTVVGPDVAYFTDANTKAELHPKWGHRPPVLAVEVLSPNDKSSEVISKVADYLRCGVRIVWIVDYELERVAVYWPNYLNEKFGSTDTITGGDELPGFSCPVSEFFRLPGDPPATIP